jgi:hypothetical protein
MFTTLLQIFKTKIPTMISSIFSSSESTATIINKAKRAIKDTDNLNLKDKKNVLYTSTIKEPKWQTLFPFSFFYGNGKFQPIYAWIFMFCSLASIMLFLKNYAAWIAIKKGNFISEMISTADIATVLAFISSLILLYNTKKKTDLKFKQKENTPTDSNNQI